MKTLIIYYSKYGTTETCVKMLREKVQGQVTAVNLLTEAAPDLGGYDFVLIGTPIYVGQLPKKMNSFLNRQRETLMHKKIGLFICAGHEEELHIYLEKSFPVWLLAKVMFIDHVGHGIDFQRANFFVKFMLKKMFKITESYLQLKGDAIDQLAANLNRVGA